MDSIALWFHHALMNVCVQLADKHPNHAGIYLALPLLIDALALCWVALTFWLGICAQAAYFRRISGAHSVEMPTQMHVGEPGFKAPRITLPTGDVIEARYTPHGELDHWEPVRHGTSVASIGPRARA